PERPHAPLPICKIISPTSRKASPGLIKRSIKGSRNSIKRFRNCDLISISDSRKSKQPCSFTTGCWEQCSRLSLPSSLKSSVSDSSPNRDGPYRTSPTYHCFPAAEFGLSLDFLRVYCSRTNF